ncbi:MlaD family protein [Gordonia hydrophobica]|uniref:MlaD family protein n=1 Tax=Gordonia hydrophobica TaxID=40516 RepID=A0ABZ2U5D4_9ACTN|nr:MlaD family protein [Gordonia hydrophobica]MBM7367364.1 virulence factor Mce-like protein [Gordonia hydrophobica]
MITKTRLSVLGMLVILVVSVLYIFNVGLHLMTVGAKYASITVQDTNGILVGSRVLLRGIEIGHVTEISQTPEGAKITWDYQDSQQIPTASDFRIDNLSALGEAYVAVLPTTEAGPYLADHATIAGPRVREASTFKDMSKQVTEVLTQVDPKQVKNVFHQLNAGLPDDIEVLGDLNRVGELLVTQMMRNEDSLRTLLATMQPLLMQSSRLPGDMARLTPEIRDFGKMFAYLEDGVKDAIDWSGPMYTGITEGASPLVALLQKFLDDNSGDLKIIGENLLPVTAAGAASMRTVDAGKFLDTLIAATNRGGLTIHIPGGGR